MAYFVVFIVFIVVVGEKFPGWVGNGHPIKHTEVGGNGAGFRLWSSVIVSSAGQFLRRERGRGGKRREGRERDSLLTGFGILTEVGVLHGLLRGDAFVWIHHEKATQL